MIVLVDTFLPLALARKSSRQPGSSFIKSTLVLNCTSSLAHSKRSANARAVVPANRGLPDELVMAHVIGSTAFGRIEKFEDNKTEQVWELFQEEFSRAVVSADGLTAWI